MTTHRGHRSDLCASCPQSSQKLAKHFGLLLRVVVSQIARHLTHVSMSDCEIQRHLGCCVPLDQAAIVELSSSGPDTADQSNVHALTPSTLLSPSPPNWNTTWVNDFDAPTGDLSMKSGHDQRTIPRDPSRAVDRDPIDQNAREREQASSTIPGLTDPTRAHDAEGGVALRNELEHSGLPKPSRARLNPCRRL